MKVLYAILAIATAVTLIGIVGSGLQESEPEPQMRTNEERQIEFQRLQQEVIDSYQNARGVEMSVEDMMVRALQKP